MSSKLRKVEEFPEGTMPKKDKMTSKEKNTKTVSNGILKVNL